MSEKCLFHPHQQTEGKVTWKSCSEEEEEDPASSSLTSLSSSPLNKVNGGRDHRAHFSALSERDSDDLELPLALVCAHVTIMIRIDDRTFWFHCLGNGTGEEICWFYYVRLILTSKNGT